MRAVSMTYRLARHPRSSGDPRRHRSNRLPAFVAVLAGLALGLTRPLPAAETSAPVAASQPAGGARRPDTRPAASDAIAKAWAELTHRNPAVRESARLKLMAMDANQLPAFRKLVAASRPLAPSQAVALREIVTQVFLAGRTYEAGSRDGFLGVRLGDVTINLRADAVELPPDQPFAANEPDGAHGVVIVERMPGFCGARAFQDGDIILAIDERPDVRIGIL